MQSISNYSLALILIMFLNMLPLPCVLVCCVTYHIQTSGRGCLFPHLVTMQPEDEMIICKVLYFRKSHFCPTFFLRFLEKKSVQKRKCPKIVELNLTVCSCGIQDIEERIKSKISVA